MTPTLLGGAAAWVDIDGDGRRDLAVWDGEVGTERPQVFLRRGDRYLADPTLRPSAARIAQWQRQGLVRSQFDRIAVNKLIYFLRPPRRGEIVVFKTPALIFNPQSPIYIKRLVGEPGEVLTFDPDGGLIVNGKRAVQPEFFVRQRYSPEIDTLAAGYRPQADMIYLLAGPRLRRILQIEVPPGQAYVFGDNTQSSLDSRYWGGVPLELFKGRAFLRLWPLGRFGFLK
jgi:signal peptidase I